VGQPWEGSFCETIRDSNGTVVGILAVDETADFVNQYEYANVFNLVEVT
jgi:hypothetical protein